MAICKRLVLIAVFALLIVGTFFTVQFLYKEKSGLPSIFSADLLRFTTNGPVQGIEQISSLGQKFYSFRGIPFAAPPITGLDPFTGESVDRRFKATEPLTYVWKEPFKAFNFSKMCVQPTIGISAFVTGSNEQSENCLHLNIYVPAGGAPKKTVLVFIHGGSFSVGSATDFLYGPDFLLSQDNILVTMQYRLGVFGFLNLGTYPYTGNMGLKDQQQALKWIHANIENFSGQSDQILLFGQSAGGAAVHYHLLNAESRKYFTRLFASSGSALSTIFLRKAHHMQQIQECSQTRDSVKLFEFVKMANVSVLDECFASKSMLFFQPTIESPSITGAFLTKTPEEIYNLGEAPEMDAMFSVTTQETLGINPMIDRLFDSLWDKNSKPTLPEAMAASKLPQLACERNYTTAFSTVYENQLSVLKELYFSNINDRAAFKENIRHFFSDLLLGFGIVKSVELQTQTNYNRAVWNEPKRTFLFRFDVNTGINFFAINTKTEYTGATHGDDLCFLFHCHSLDQMGVYETALERKDLNYAIIMRSVKMITNFARTGNPSIDSNTRLVANSPDQIFHGEVSTTNITRVRTDIKEQMHYDTWAHSENIFDVANCIAENNYTE